MKKAIIIPILALLIGCVGTINPVEWQDSYKTWTTEQRATFLMKTWQFHKSDYDRWNALPDKSPELLKILEAKYQLLERSRIPLRTYVQYVDLTGQADFDMEQQLLAWVLELQAMLIERSLR